MWKQVWTLGLKLGCTTKIEIYMETMFEIGMEHSDGNCNVN